MKNKQIKFNKTKIISAFILLLIIILISAISYKNLQSEKQYLLGKAYETQGYFDLAKTSYEKSIKLKPDSVTYNALGNLNELFGDNIEAINIYQKGIGINPKDIENYFDISKTYINIGEFDKAEKYLLLIIKDDKGTASVYSLLGTVNIEKGKWNLAEDYLKKSLELQETASAYNDLGVVYENQGLYDEAILNYQNALEINPGFALAQSNINRLS